MTDAFDVEWSEPAIEDWKRLSRHDAEMVAVVVRRFAEQGIGRIVYVDGEYLLFVDHYVVVMLIDRGTIYVDRVRNA